MKPPERNHEVLIGFYRFAIARDRSSMSYCPQGT